VLFVGAAILAAACGERVQPTEPADSGVESAVESATCVRQCAFNGVECDIDTRCVPSNVSGQCGFNEELGTCSRETRACIDACLTPRPSRCDYAGCCELVVGGTTRHVKLTRLCNNWTAGDPSLCPACSPIWDPPPEGCGECFPDGGADASAD